jgi:hypothetical protein
MRKHQLRDGHKWALLAIVITIFIAIACYAVNNEINPRQGTHTESVWMVED